MAHWAPFMFRIRDTMALGEMLDAVEAAVEVRVDGLRTAFMSGWR
jgi:hypothetical protein